MFSLRCARWASAVILLASVAACHAGSRTTRTSGATTRPPVNATTTTPSAGSTSAAPTPPSGPPRLRHLVVVIEENRSYADIIGNHDAPYLNSLAASGTTLTKSFAVAHPSEPNYVALFSGSTHGLHDDSCPHRYSGPDLAGGLHAAGLSFGGYAEGLPRAGFQGCSSGAYARKHAPWTDFTDVPAAAGKPLTAMPPDYARLPTVSFVIPDLDNDMHDGTIAQGDSWLRSHLSRYVSWARTHDSALVVTWDEDDYSENNQIPTVVVGAHVRTSHYAGRVDHYRMLRTIEWLFGLRASGAAQQRSPLTAIWTP